MLKDYLPIAGILLFVYFWIEDSWAQIVMDFISAYQGDIIELALYVLFLFSVYIFLIPIINRFVFEQWFYLMYRRFNNFISLGKNVEDCENLKGELSNIKIQLNKKTPLKKLSTTLGMIYTAINTTPSSVNEKVNINK